MRPEARGSMGCLAACLAALGCVAPSGPPEKLSAYELFSGDPRQQVAAEGVLVYELNTPLFSDHADKHRFVKLPDGGRISYREHETLEFPAGTVIAKTFSTIAAAGNRRLLETRILHKEAQGWVALPYVWNEAQDEARLSIIGATLDTELTLPDGSVLAQHEYRVPNQNQCKGCHRRAGDEMLPIGPRADQINREVEFADGRENVLDRWTRLGVLTGAPPAQKAPRAPVWDDPATGSVEQRARAWLDMNCAHCHNPEGPARTSSLDLRFGQRDPRALGVMKTPVAAGRGSGDRLYSIVPGDPEQSILVYRLESNDPGVMMPELGRSMVDTASVALVRQWIAEMPPTTPGATLGH